MRTRVWLLLLGFVLCTWVGAGPALAHASLVASSPSELQVLTDPPPQVLLVFDQPVAPELSWLTVTGPRKVRAAVGSLSHGRFGDTYLQGALTGRLPAGDYAVAWSAVSSDDGHPSDGSFSFRVLTARTIAATAQASPRPTRDGAAGVLYGVSRWLALAGFVALVGGLHFLVACWPEGRSHRAWRLQVTGAWWLLLLASAGMLASYAAYATRAPLGKIADLGLLGATLNSRVGLALVARLALLLVIALSARVLMRSNRLVVLTVGGLLAATWSATSHSESAGHPGSLVALDVLHLLAAAVWLGGLVTLGVAVLRRSGAPVQTREVVSRFSSTALVAVAVLVASGCVQAWQQLGSASPLGDSHYAQLLQLKVSLVAVTLLVAAVVRTRLLRPLAPSAGPGPTGLRRLVLAETALGVAVLTVTSLLVTTEPARATRPRYAPVLAAATASRPEPEPVYGQVAYDAGVGRPGRGTVTVAVDPPTVGASSVHLSVLDVSGRPQPVTLLTGMLRSAAPGRQPILVRFTWLAPGHFVSTGATFPAAGSWQLGIGFQLPNRATATALFGITVT